MTLTHVIESVEGKPVGVRSFADTPRGNKSAESYFRAILLETRSEEGDPTDEEIETAWKESFHECGDHTVAVCSGPAEI